MTVRVAIIGAGPSGLAALRAFESAQQEGRRNPRGRLLREAGRLWRLVELHVAHRAPTSTASRSTVPCTAICGRTAPRNASSSPTTPSKSTSAGRSPPILRAPCSTTTSRAASRRAAYTSYIKFRTPVRWVTYSEKTGKFSVTVKDLKTDTVSTSDFDYVIVAQRPLLDAQRSGVPGPKGLSGPRATCPRLPLGR